MFGRRSAAQKDDDTAWYPWDLGGERGVTRLGRVRAQVFRDWSLRTEPVQGDLLLTAEHLVFSLGPGFTTEIALVAVHGIEWLDDPLTQLLVGYREPDGEEGIAAFDLDVPPHAGRDGYDMRLRFATILADASPFE